MTAWNTTADPATGYELTFGYRDQEAYAAVVRRLVSDRVASKIGDKDPTLWGPEATPEASKRLGWVDLVEHSRPLVDQVSALRQELLGQGLDHVVLCGMGGSSLAPEVISRTAGVELTVLDSSDPDYVRSALGDRLDSTVLVVSSKSGGTVETDSQKRAYEKAFHTAGHDPADHVVVVTDPGSPLQAEAAGAGYRVFEADPTVGGRYSALTAFGLVPSGLAGADIGALLDEAAAIGPALRADSPDNPALRLGGLLGLAATSGVDKVVLADAGTFIVGFGDWVEQLIAESTGKLGRGILPVVVEGTDAPNFDPSTIDGALVSIGADFVFDTLRPASGYGAAVDAPLGAQMLLWEYAVAVAGQIVGINPFDQPDVESAKSAARGLLDADGDRPAPAFTDGAVQVHGSDSLLPDGTDSLTGALRALLDRLDVATGYAAVMAYLDRDADAAMEQVRPLLARRTSRPTTFGWGPRFLHSTGQFHKGGPAVGVFLQVTGEPQEDLEVPGRGFSFGEFIAAQAIGDGSVLAEHGRPVLRLHLTDRAAGIAQLIDALR